MGSQYSLIRHHTALTAVIAKGQIWSIHSFLMIICPQYDFGQSPLSHPEQSKPLSGIKLRHRVSKTAESMKHGDNLDQKYDQSDMWPRGWAAPGEPAPVSCAAGGFLSSVRASCAAVFPSFIRTCQHAESSHRCWQQVDCQSSTSSCSDQAPDLLSNILSLFYRKNGSFCDARLSFSSFPWSWAPLFQVQEPEGSTPHRQLVPAAGEQHLWDLTVLQGDPELFKLSIYIQLNKLENKWACE